MTPVVSIIIRTLNEEEYLNELLLSIKTQRLTNFRIEIILVDSGSTDLTIEIAKKHGCAIVHIQKSEFSFGRSLNIGCQKSCGEFLVFISGHCVPADEYWLEHLIQPLLDHPEINYVYGRQMGGRESRFSEKQIFKKYYPEASRIPSEGFFCNNANASLRASTWQSNRFDEDLTGLEDMALAKKLVVQGHQLAYAADAKVFHFHHETWKNIRLRYERESLALQHIMPEVHISFADFLRYFTIALLHDSAAALEEKCFFGKLSEIIIFRLMQFLGSYRGNHAHRQLSKKMKEIYFYPKHF